MPVEPFWKSHIDKLLDRVALLPTDDDTIGTAQLVADLIKEKYREAESWEVDAVIDRYKLAFPSISDESIGEWSRPVPAAAPLEAVALDEKDRWTSLVPDGFYRRYLDWTAEQESPTCYHLAAALTCSAQAIGRHPQISWQTMKTFPNLYTLLVGPTGARKSTAIKLAVALYKEALAKEFNVLSDEGTHQGYFDELKRRYDLTQRWSDGLLVASEFSLVFGDERHKTELAKWAADWIECGDTWGRSLRGSGTYLRLKRLYVNMIGGSNMPWLRTLPETAITGGFMPRILIFHAHDKRHWCAFPTLDDKVRTTLIEEIRSSYQGAPEAIEFSNGSKALLKDWYEGEIRERYDKSDDEQFQAWLSRKQAAVMKIAVNWQFADHGPHQAISEKWTLQAIRLVDSLDTDVREVYRELGTARESAATVAVQSFLQRRGGAATWKQITSALKNKFNSKSLMTGLEMLKSTGEVSLVRTPNRLAAVWTLTVALPAKPIRGGNGKHGT